MAQPPEDKSFFSRWSKRKRSADTAPAAETQEEPSAPEAAADTVESLSEEDLAAFPSPDTFTIETDIRPFLQKGVPQAMRNAALRKKWLLTPAIRDHADPAVDYAWDWNTPGGVPGDGLAPSAEKAAAMLRDLVSPRCDAAREESTEEYSKSTSNSATTPPTTAPDAAVPHTASEEGESAENTALEDAQSAEPDMGNHKGNQSDMEEDMPRKRHGSALPD